MTGTGNREIGHKGRCRRGPEGGGGISVGQGTTCLRITTGVGEASASRSVPGEREKRTGQGRVKQKKDVLVSVPEEKERTTGPERET